MVNCNFLVNSPQNGLRNCFSEDALCRSELIHCDPCNPVHCKGTPCPEQLKTISSVCFQSRVQLISGEIRKCFFIPCLAFAKEKQIACANRSSGSA